MNYRDTTMVYNNVKFYYAIKKNKRIMEALSGVSPFRMKKALKSYDDFNNLKLNEIVKLEEIATTIGENVKLDEYIANKQN